MQHKHAPADTSRRWPSWAPARHPFVVAYPPGNIWYCVDVLLNFPITFCEDAGAQDNGGGREKGGRRAREGYPTLPGAKSASPRSRRRLLRVVVEMTGDDEVVVTAYQYRRSSSTEVTDETLYTTKRRTLWTYVFARPRWPIRELAPGIIMDLDPAGEPVSISRYCVRRRVNLSEKLLFSRSISMGISKTG